ncbi:DUF6961 family protein [Sphingopyxis granuli]|jgi:hypothetical protein|uniref:DUF6961 family protein n=1 Tax=Sphingopyxis granuli TaxID=267128 RepID=UPI001BB062BC|nr:hypothetical protein [Sphingopyxis granuli]QUM74023.1 hypothetical protein ICN83_09370 [Sphingopyxis granuli]
MMGAKADHDLLGQAMAAERQYGDRAPEFIAQKAQALRRDGEYSEADFWAQVAGCLTDLHAIKFAGGGKAAAEASEHCDLQNRRPVLRATTNPASNPDR